jgi:hypothetical protein
MELVNEGKKAYVGEQFIFSVGRGKYNQTKFLVGVEGLSGHPVFCKHVVVFHLLHVIFSPALVVEHGYAGVKLISKHIG